MRGKIILKAMVPLLAAILTGLIGFTASANDAKTLVIGLSADPKSLGPTATDNDASVSFRVYSAITQSGKSFGPAPDLAQSWEASEDFLSYTFHLNPAAKFHDGTPVTSEDVKFSVMEVTNKLVHVSRRGLIPSIKSVETPDDHTIVFHLKQPYPEFLNPYYGVGPRNSYVVKKADWEGTDYLNNPNNLKPIGSGPFKFVEWVKGSHIILERWEDYWGKKPAVEKIVYRIITDPTAMALAFENGEVDWVPYTLAAPEVKRLNSVTGKEAEFHGVPCGDSISLRFNLRRERFQDINVRRAFVYAINRERIPDLVYFGGAVPATGQIMNSAFNAWWYNPNVKQVPYDPKMANTLLDKAGYPVGSDGWRFHTTLKHATFFPEDIHVAELVKADLAKVGVDAKIISLDYAAWIDQCFVNWDFDLNLSSLCSGPVPTAMGRFTTDNIVPVGWANDMGFSNLEYDKLHRLQTSETDRKQRLVYLYRMQEILVEEQPMVHLVHKKNSSAWNSAKFTAKPEEFWTGGLGYFLMRMSGVHPTK
jgi:peptide/nickel transport system substrate-binding protein